MVWESPPADEGSVPSTLVDPVESEPAALAGSAPQEIEWQDVPDPPNGDPNEEFNRRQYEWNAKFERWVMAPTVRGYKKISTPGFRQSVNNFLWNVGEPVVIFNKIFQFDLWQGTQVLGRFCINSTVGLLGFFDPAARWGIERQQADFGQTLYTYGFARGRYWIMPFIGPSTTRNAAGVVVDFFLRPGTWLFTPAGLVVWYSGKGVARLEEVTAQLEALRATSVDEYATIRSVYLMDRMSFLLGRGLTEDEIDELLYFD